MSRLKKKLIVVGDRLLIRPEEGEERTHAGLYLPQSAVAARQARGGWIVSVGPGVPVVNPMDMMDEHWTDNESPHDPQPRFMPLQAQEGDYALFLHKAAVEITFEKKNYLIVPNSAVLVLVREGFDSEPANWEGNSN
ncbi:MAG: co-chaperone GroES family protein [Candidatus Krumholzibacteriota bacterium]